MTQAVDYLFLFMLAAAIFICGAAAVHAMHPQISQFSMLALAYPVGAGFLSFILFTASWAGVEINIYTVLITYILLLASAILIFVLRRNANPASTLSPLKPESGTGRSTLDLLVLILVAGLGLAAAILSISRSYSTWDAMGIWAIKGYSIVQEGSIYAAKDWGSHSLSYPLNLPLQIAIYRLTTADALAGSKFIFPLYYFSLLVGIYAFISRSIGRAKALAATLFIGTIPILFEHATIGYANLPFSYYLVMGFLALQPGEEGTLKASPILGGVLLGLATWTRPEGIFLVLVGLGIIFLADSESKSRRHFWLCLLGGVMLFALPWQVFTAEYGGGGLMGRSLRAAWTGWSTGEFHLDALYWTARYAARQAIEPSVWGLLFPAGAILLAANFRDNLKMSHERGLPILLGLIGGLGLAVFIYYYLASYTGDVRYLLGTSVNRIFMPVWILFAVYCGSYS